MLSCKLTLAGSRIRLWTSWLAIIQLTMEPTAASALRFQGVDLVIASLKFSLIPHNDEPCLVVVVLRPD